MNICGQAGFFLNIAIPVLIWINVSCISIGKNLNWKEIMESSMEKGSEAYSSEISQNMIKMKAVKDKILNGYDKAIRPTIEGSKTTEVYTAFIPRQIIEVDEEMGLFILDSYLYMSWEDPRLNWNSTTEYDGYLQLSQDTLWLPDISVYNSRKLQVNPLQEVPLLLAPSGILHWFPPIHTQTSCPALLEAAYPYEVVTCTVIMGCFVHDGWEIDYSHGEELFLHEFENINPRWELISGTKFIRNVTQYEGYDDPYISHHGVFPLKRRTPPEIAATRNPCILVMLLTLSIFWLPTNSSRKVLLGGILLLMLTILLVYVACSTKFPMGAVLAASFLQSTMYILVITLLLQIFVIFNLCSIKGPVRPPQAAMQFLTGPFGKYACLRVSSNDNIPVDRIQLKEDSQDSIESPSPKEDWMLFAAGLDRLFFLMMSIAMIAIHHL